MAREDVLNMARLVLTQCDGAVTRDKKGYDSFDAVTVRQFLNPDIFGISELADEEVEYLRRKLLRYRKQIWKIAIESGISEALVKEGLKKLDTPVAESSIIIRGKVGRGSPYGRISHKWYKAFMAGKSQIKTIDTLIVHLG